MNRALQIDPEFQALCPPLTEEEYGQLEENILTEGVIYTPLIVWEGIIVDGHNRYQIAQAHPDILFQTYEKQFENRYDALSWICKNQLGRRNLTPQQKMYLIGQRYEAEKESASFHGNQYTASCERGGDNSCPHQTESRTRKKIAEEVGISQGTVQNARDYAKGVDAAEKVLPGIKTELLTGSIRPSAKEVAAVARADSAQRLQRAEELRTPKAARSRAEARKEILEIQKISEAMRNNHRKVNEDSMLETLRGTMRDTIRVCNILFSDYPRLLTDDTYRQRVIAIMQETKQYILKIEGGGEIR